MQWFAFINIVKKISTNDFNDFDVVVTDEERKIAIDAVEWAVKTLKK